MENKMEKNVALIIEGFGHGMISLLIAQVMKMRPVAFSMKDNEEDFNKEVNQIYNNLSFFVPNLQKANWEDREELLSKGWNIRQSLLDGEITDEIWKMVAAGKFTPVDTENLPKFSVHNALMFVPQKLISDKFCGMDAKEQSLDPSLFDFLKVLEFQLVLGQHFHKVNDLEKVQNLAKEFHLYVPGMTENPEIFGIRGIQHKMYWNLYNQLKGCIGIAGTHSWYLLTCFPQIPQIILYNKKGVERWEAIAKAYQAAGHPIYCLGFDENTDKAKLSQEMEELARKVF